MQLQHQGRHPHCLCRVPKCQPLSRGWYLVFLLFFSSARTCCFPAPPFFPLLARVVGYLLWDFNACAHLPDNLQCFAAGVEVPGHKKDHDYFVVVSAFVYACCERNPNSPKIRRKKIDEERRRTHSSSFAHAFSHTCRIEYNVLCIKQTGNQTRS